MTNYEYTKIYGRYFCLQQNFLLLGWWIYSRNKTLPSFITTKLILKLLLYKLHLLKKNNILKLPVQGIYCLSVHDGYKVFNINQGTVFKIFSNSSSSEIIREEIEQLRKMGKYDFAPSLLRWDIEHHWYEEEYLYGVTGYIIAPSDPVVFMDNYFNYVAPCIEKLILAEKPRVTNVGDYVVKILDIFKKAILSRKEYDIALVEEIENFVYSISNQLQSTNDYKIYLVLSHGDFHQFNLFATKYGTKLIDWECSDYQSVLFDFYNYFFSQLYLKNTTKDMTSEIQKAVVSLNSILKSNVPEVTKDMITLSHMYRWMYYIERIATFIDKLQLDPNKIIRWIDEFKEFERIKENN